ncbi:hypothetical protein [Streptomyces sp. NPDC012888]|uniref:hypothetical protein n=1 Tax=Streptomyces sp. NPDC012888 TaxID=3364855 RepID=UPI0036B680E0
MGQQTSRGTRSQQTDGKDGKDGKDGRDAGKLDLSVAQVAGSSLATVAAALLASKLGVYGTILGAGVVSVVATAGGPVIQHLFRRTGDKVRETARPRARRVPAGPEPADRTMTLRHQTPSGAEYGTATTHGTRLRTRRRTAVGAAVAFAVAVGGIGTYEAVAGTAVSRDGGTIFSGGTRKADRERPAPERPEPAPGGAGRSGGAPRSHPAPDPSRSAGDRDPRGDRGPSESPGTGGTGGTGSPGGTGPGPTPPTTSPTATTPPAPPATSTPPGSGTPDPRRSPQGGGGTGAGPGPSAGAAS